MLKKIVKKPTSTGFGILPVKICSVIFRNENQIIPELNQNVLKSNAALCKKSNIPFEITEIIVPDNEQRFAQLSNEWRVAKLSKENFTLYIDWDIKLLSIPVFTKKAGCGLKGPYRDMDFLWSGENGQKTFSEFTEFSKNFKSQYRACIAFEGFETIDTSKILINYCTGLGRTGLVY